MRRVELKLMSCVIALGAAALLGTSVAGCGDAQTSDSSPVAAAVLAAAAPAPSTTVSSSALQKQRIARHARIMAEQGRSADTAEPGGDTVTTAVRALQQQPQTVSAAPPNQTAQTSSQTPSLVPASPSTTRTILTQGQTPLRGTWGGTAGQLAAFLLAASPDPRFTVEVSTLADYYVRYCAETGLRADLLWAQMIHETGYGRYGGSVEPEQNNYAGIGATGGGEPGVFFPTAEAGVKAHVAHMVAYVYGSSPVAWASAASDPRFDMVAPKGEAAVLADLNGRWAVPGTGYGQAIEEIARRINASG